MGADQPRPSPTRTSTRRSTRSSTASPPARPRSYAGAKRQLNAWAYAGLDDQLELEARSSRRWRAPTTSSRASPRSWRSARPRSAGADAAPVTVRSRDTIAAALRARPTLTSRRRLLALALVAVAVGGPRVAGLALADLWSAGAGGSPQRRPHRHALQDHLRRRARGLLRRRGRAASTPCSSSGRARAPSPAQIRGNTRLEIAWTVGAALILVVLGDRSRSSSCRASATRDASAAGGLPGRRRRRSPTPRAAMPPNGKSLSIDVNGQQYIWRYTYGRRRPQQLQQRVRVHRDGGPDRHDGHARHPRPGRRRTRGGSRSSAASSTRSRATPTTRGSRSRRGCGHSSPASAPSCAAATTRT